MSTYHSKNLIAVGLWEDSSERVKDSMRKASLAAIDAAGQTESGVETFVLTYCRWGAGGAKMVSANPENATHVLVELEIQTIEEPS